MNAANWIALLTPILVIAGGLWAIIKLSNKADMKEQRVKDLERELDKKDTKIQYLEDAIERKNDVIRSLK